jgi:hypothetical protein
MGIRGHPIEQISVNWDSLVRRDFCSRVSKRVHPIEQISVKLGLPSEERFLLERGQKRTP